MEDFLLTNRTRTRGVRVDYAALAGGGKAGVKRGPNKSVNALRREQDRLRTEVEAAEAQAAAYVEEAARILESELGGPRTASKLRETAAPFYPEAPLSATEAALFLPLQLNPVQHAQLAEAVLSPEALTAHQQAARKHRSAALARRHQEFNEGAPLRAPRVWRQLTPEASESQRVAESAASLVAVEVANAALADALEKDANAMQDEPDSAIMAAIDKLLDEDPLPAPGTYPRAYLPRPRRVELPTPVSALAGPATAPPPQASPNTPQVARHSTTVAEYLMAPRRPSMESDAPDSEDSGVSDDESCATRELFPEEEDEDEYSDPGREHWKDGEVVLVECPHCDKFIQEGQFCPCTWTATEQTLMKPHGELVKAINVQLIGAGHGQQ